MLICEKLSPLGESFFDEVKKYIGYRNSLF